jgi:hypothetical protein
MCCYTRHLKEQMLAVGLECDRAGRREADRRIRDRLSMPEADCPDVWYSIKRLETPEMLRLLAPVEPA